MNKYARLTFLIALLFASATLLAAQASQANPFIGTWKMNAEKSKFSPGPAPKSQIVTVSPEGKTTVEEVYADGKASNWSFGPSGDTAVKIEGLENSTVVEKRTGNILQHTWNFNGDNRKGRAVLSSDGKTIRYTQTGTDKEGRSVRNVVVYDRQSS